MRLNLNKNQLGDLIIMLLFDSAFDDEFLEQNTHYRELIDELTQQGLQNRTFKRFFKVDGQIRARYKMFRDAFDSKGKRVTIELLADMFENEDDFVRYIITETVKKITGKENPNPDKLTSLQESILSDINNEGELNE